MNSMRGTAMSDVLPHPGEASRAKPNLPGSPITRFRGSGLGVQELITEQIRVFNKASP